MGNGGQIREPPRGVTFEDAWAAIQETAQQLKIMGEKTDRRMEETARQMKETDKRIGKLTNRFGDIIEHMIIPNLVSKFQELGFTFTQAGNLKITDKKHNIFMEIDALLENGDKAMVVEIKTKPKNDDIEDHLERMKKMRTYADARNDKRIYLGAVAGVVFEDSVKHYALRNGFYVLEPSEETFTVTEPKDAGFTPREW
jgi:hypothetical protein